MKSLTSTLALLACLALCSQSKAQQKGQSSLFQGVPDSLFVSTTSIQPLFRVPAGKPAEFVIGNFRFHGTVTYNEQKYHNLRSMIVQLDSHRGGILSLSAITEADGRITYVGQMISDKHGDILDLQQNAAGKYVLRKLKKDDMIQD